jgi:hypothetical protein
VKGIKWAASRKHFGQIGNEWAKWAKTFCFKIGDQMDYAPHKYKRENHLGRTETFLTITGKNKTKMPSDS